MPYIKPERRERLDAKIEELVQVVDLNHREGELNYIVTRLFWELKGEGKYHDFNELIGAVECAKMEFYRRKLAPYEDEKIKVNGDIKSF